MIVRVRPALAHLATLWQGLSFVVGPESLMRNQTFQIAQIKKVSLDSIVSIRAIILPETNHVCQLSLHVVHLSCSVHMGVSTQI